MLKEICRHQIKRTQRQRNCAVLCVLLILIAKANDLQREFIQMAVAEIGKCGIFWRQHESFGLFIQNVYLKPLEDSHNRAVTYD